MLLPLLKFSIMRTSRITGGGTFVERDDTSGGRARFELWREYTKFALMLVFDGCTCAASR